MKINQLFKEKIPEELLLKVLASFNLSGLGDETYFSKVDLTKNNTRNKIEELKEELKQYYLPCKYKIYIENLTEGKCITILRQILKLYQVKLLSIQKYAKYKKITLYCIMRNQNETHHVIQVDHQVTQVVF